jgi:hypothetical protein
MIPDRRDLPDDAADWRDIVVELPRLTPDTPDDCPLSLADIMEYVRMESADTDSVPDDALKFVRTASIGDSSVWLWSLTESDGTVCYVTVTSRPNRVTLGLSDANGLTPEQYMLAEHYDEVYW